MDKLVFHYDKEGSVTQFMSSGLDTTACLLFFPFRTPIKVESFWSKLGHHTSDGYNEDEFENLRTIGEVVEKIQTPVGDNILTFEAEIGDHVHLSMDDDYTAAWGITNDETARSVILWCFKKVDANQDIYNQLGLLKNNYFTLDECGEISGVYKDFDIYLRRIGYYDNPKTPAPSRSQRS